MNNSLINCTLCFEPVSAPMSVTICLDNGTSYSEFGCILHNILKLSNCKSFRTKACCVRCADNVVETFSSILRMNILAILAEHRTSSNSLQDALEKGCNKCAAVYPTIEELCDHYLCHFYESYKGQSVEIGDSMDQDVAQQDKKENLVEEFLDENPGDLLAEHCYGKLTETREKTKKTSEKKSGKKISGMKNTDSRICDLCGRTLNTWISLRNHIIRHRKDEKFPRPAKGRKMDRKVLKPRKLEKLEGAPMLCPKCGLSFKQNYQLVTHMVLIHNEKQEDCKVIQKRYRAWDCSVCGGRFSNFKMLQSHQDKEHDGKGAGLRVQCEPCGRWYKNNKMLSQHITLKHGDTFPHGCEHCGKRYLEKKNLLKHITKQHSVEKLTKDILNDKPALQETYLIYVPQDDEREDNNYASNMFSTSLDENIVSLEL